MPDRYALVGDPIAASPSPAMHNAGFKARGLDATYELRPTTPESLAELRAELAEHSWAGLNVTTPLKTLLTGDATLSPNARRAGAVNTLIRTAAGYGGELTDVEGVVDPLRAHGYAGGGNALLLGAGGAARAAALALESLGCRLHIAARRVEQAAALARSLELPPATTLLSLGDADALGRSLAQADVVVQATPVGRHGEAHALTWAQTTRPLIAFEMLYRPVETPFLVQAHAAGHEVIFGWEMLLAQGLASFALWCGEPVPEAEMRAALRQALP